MYKKQVMYDTKTKIIFKSNMSRKVFIYDFSAHINTISKTSVSIIKRTLKEQSSQYIHVSQKTYQNIKGL